MTTVDRNADCQANRQNAKPFCKRCNRHQGQGCGEHGPYADPKIFQALNTITIDGEEVHLIPCGVWTIFRYKNYDAKADEHIDKTEFAKALIEAAKQHQAYTELKQALNEALEEVIPR